MKSDMMVLAVVGMILLMACRGNSFVVKSFVDTNNSKCYYYEDTPGRIKAKYVVLRRCQEDWVYMNIDDSVNLLTKEYDSAVADSNYRIVTLYKNERYAVVIKVNWFNDSEEYPLHGLLLVKNRKGDMITKKIATMGYVE